MLKKIIIIGFMSLLIFSLNSCKKDLVYNIRGAWDMTLTSNEGSGTCIITFSGSLDTGTFVFVSDDNVVNGTYTVQSQKVTLLIVDTKEEDIILMEGNFTGEDNMSGTATDSLGNVKWTWTATRR